MTTQNNTGVSKKIRDGLKINQATDVVPTRVADSIVPVFEVAAEKKILICDNNAVDTTTAAIMTTHAVKKTFIVGCQVVAAKDIVSDSVFTRITALLKGRGETNLIWLRYEPLTAGQMSEVVMLPHPLELEKGTNITLRNSAATASIDATGLVYYYEED